MQAFLWEKKFALGKVFSTISKADNLPDPPVPLIAIPSWLFDFPLFPGTTMYLHNITLCQA